MATELVTDLEQRVVDSINSARAAEELPALKIEVHLNDSAQSHSTWMGETGTFSHTGEAGSTATERIEDAGFPLTGSWQTAENIAFRSISGNLDAGEVDAMHQGLMDSPGHHANIMDPDAAYVGVGLSVGHADGFDQEVVFLTQHFADTDGQVLVQEEIGGKTFLQAYLQGDPVGEPLDPDLLPPDDPDRPDDPGDDDEQDADADSGGGGCFVATAVYGDPSHPDVVDLRRFRDEVLVEHRAGRAFIRAYRIAGPRLAALVSTHGVSGRVLRTLLSPLARLAGRWAGRRG
jgi:hypothetical protein